MKRNFKIRILAVLAAIVLLTAAMGGCDSGTGSAIFRYDISEAVDNLDPQFATSANARMIIGNLYEGLVVLEDGELLPGASSSYSVSDDGLRYTFVLRDNLCWSDDGNTPLTSKDFLFAFRRLFNPDTPSPYASDYSCIENAADVLGGRQPLSALGVRAVDARTIEFSLAYANPFFLELLSAPPAVPCNEDFFTQSQGRYGLEQRFVQSNGPFVLDKWNDEQILLRKNTVYQSEHPVAAGGVNLYIGRENPVKLFRDGKADLVVVPYEELPTVSGATLQNYDKTTWCIVFNQADSVLGNPLIRQGFVYATDHERLAEYLTPYYSRTAMFVPPAMLLLGESYRALAGNTPPLPHDTERGAYLFDMGLESLELDTLPPLTMYVPDTQSHLLVMSQLQQDWQKHLGAYINIEPLPPGQIEDRLRSGNYQMLLMPFSPSSGRVDSLLNVFSSSSSQNYTGYRNPRYDAILLESIRQDSVEDTAKKFSEAEQMLLSDAVVLPVYFETTTYAVAKGVTGIELSPFAGKIRFKGATE